MPPQDIKDKNHMIKDKPRQCRSPRHPPRDISTMTTNQTRMSSKQSMSTRAKIQVKENELTGEQILKYAELDKGQIRFISGATAKTASKYKIINDARSKNGMQFSCNSQERAVTDDPKRIAKRRRTQLKERGFTLDFIEEGERIYILFKKFPAPITNIQYGVDGPPNFLPHRNILVPVLICFGRIKAWALERRDTVPKNAGTIEIIH